jgi:ethanolamine transporter EutH
MAGIENGFKIGAGIGVGIGMFVLAPVLSPILSSAVKPVAKAVIKQGMVVYGKGREVMAESYELVEDLVAEAKAELAEKTAAQAGEAKQNKQPEDYIVRGY